MSIYVKIGKKILKNPNIIRPHVKTKDISELNFKKMKDMGMEKIIFGKRFTLTDENGHAFLSDYLIDPPLKDCIEAFGPENIIIIANAMD